VLTKTNHETLKNLLKLYPSSKVGYLFFLSQTKNMLACRSQVATTTTTAAATSVVSLRRSSRSKRNTAVAPLLCEQQKRNDFAKKNSSISNNINTLRKLPEMLTASAFVSATLFAENAFAAGPDAEELKQFLIGFWNFRTGDVTSILLYTVAPIALPYLIFSQVRERKRERERISFACTWTFLSSFIVVVVVWLFVSLTLPSILVD
jgi:hypothetical protein